MNIGLSDSALYTGVVQKKKPSVKKLQKAYRGKM